MGRDILTRPAVRVLLSPTSDRAGSILKAAYTTVHGELQIDDLQTEFQQAHILVCIDQSSRLTNLHMCIPTLFLNCRSISSTSQRLMAYYTRAIYLLTVLKLKTLSIDIDEGASPPHVTIY